MPRNMLGTSLLDFLVIPSCCQTTNNDIPFRMHVALLEILVGTEVRYQYTMPLCIQPPNPLFKMAGQTSASPLTPWLPRRPCPMQVHPFLSLFRSSPLPDPTRRRLDPLHLQSTSKLLAPSLLVPMMRVMNPLQPVCCQHL